WLRRRRRRPSAPLRQAEGSARAGRGDLCGLFGDQLAPQYFADQALGQLLAELDLLRHFVASPPYAAIVHGLLLGGRLDVPQHYVYLDCFAPALVRNADGHDLAHFRVLEQRLFHVSRVDVHAAGDDQVLLAIDDAEKAVGILASDIASEQPIAP